MPELTGVFKMSPSGNYEDASRLRQIFFFSNFMFVFTYIHTVSVLTIQKRVPVAKSAYCSMVDRTLKIRHTRTMRKLDEDKTFLSQTSPPPTVTVSLIQWHMHINQLQQTKTNKPYFPGNFITRC